MGERPPASAPRLPARPRRDFAPRRQPQAEKFLCRRTSSRSPLRLLAPRLAVLFAAGSPAARGHARPWVPTLSCEEHEAAIGVSSPIRESVLVGGVGEGVGTRLRSSGPTGGGGVRGNGCS